MEKKNKDTRTPPESVAHFLLHLSTYMYMWKKEWEK